MCGDNDADSHGREMDSHGREMDSHPLPQAHLSMDRASISRLGLVMLTTNTCGGEGERRRGDVDGRESRKYRARTGLSRISVSATIKAGPGSALGEGCAQRLNEITHDEVGVVVVGRQQVSVSLQAWSGVHGMG